MLSFADHPLSMRISYPPLFWMSLKTYWILNRIELRLAFDNICEIHKKCLNLGINNQSNTDHEQILLLH